MRRLQNRRSREPELGAAAGEPFARLREERRAARQTGRVSVFSLSNTRPTVRDVVAGVSVALVLIPQSLAYAELAGLPPHVGLFAAALPPLLAALFVSSPYLQTGPVALTSLLTLGALEGRAELASVDYIKMAALLALIVGVARLLLGLFKLGGIAYVMTAPMLLGFTTGAAILIVASQLPTIFGVDPDTSGVLERAWSAVIHPGEWGGGALLFAAATLLLMFGGRRFHQAFPGVLVAVLVATVISAAANYDGPTVGDLPGGFINISLALPWSMFGELLLPGLVIAVVGYAEPASISRMFAAEDDIPWSSSRELVSQGVANLAASVSGSFPVGGSFSRSSLNRFAGATSGWSGAVTGAVVLVFLPFAPMLESLPRAVLGAIVFGAVYPLIKLVTVGRLWGENRGSAVVATGTLVATLVSSPNVELGVLFGVALSSGWYIIQRMTGQTNQPV